MKGLVVSGLAVKHIFSKGLFVKCSTDGEEVFKTGYGEPGTGGVWEFPGDWIIPSGLRIHCVHTCIIDARVVRTHDVCVHACAH